MSEEEQRYVSIDAEYGGPIAPKYPLLSIGACLVYRPEVQFYVEIKPLKGSIITDSARNVLGEQFIQKCMTTGLEPVVAMTRFAEWFEKKVPGRPIGVFIHKASDWMQIAWYFHNFLGYCPLGINGLDLKEFYMGKFDKEWRETSKKAIHEAGFVTSNKHNHNALADAIEQAELFRLIRKV
jgi:hypothetical protein